MAAPSKVIVLKEAIPNGHVLGTVVPQEKYLLLSLLRCPADSAKGKLSGPRKGGQPKNWRHAAMQ